MHIFPLQVHWNLLLILAPRDHANSWNIGKRQLQLLALVLREGSSRTSQVSTPDEITAVEVLNMVI
jgi:hypothetical protein